MLLYIPSHAQLRTISGAVSDSIQPLTGAAVTLLKSQDSLIAASAFTDNDGKFIIRNISPGSYLLKLSFIGYVEKFLNADLSSGDFNTGNIRLTESSKSLREVNIEGNLPPVQVIGDTTQFNADAFKVNKDANTEDLVTKMPGITVQDGKVQAQGEEVKKVLIDGKAYLGDDPNAALKSLPAEVVEKIQVFDKKSDQSEFTGFDDGNTTKTINIVTRPQFRNGTFGRIFGGYGSEERWKTGLNVNSFKDKRKFTVIGFSNNINEQNFSTDDLLGVIGTSASGRQGGQRGGSFSRGGGGGRWQPQNEASNFLVDQRSGVSKTNSGGINYVNKWNKSEFSGSYFFNRADNNSGSTILRQYYTPESDGLVYREENSGQSQNINHRANMRYEFKFDSLKSILIQPRISFQDNSGRSSLTGNNSDATGNLSNANSSYRNDQEGISVSVPLFYRHAFRKKGRTVSLNVNPSYSKNTGNNFLESLTDYATDSIPNDQLNQFSEPNTTNRNISSDLTYTEPLDSNSQLSFTYRNSYTSGESEKLTYSYSPADELYNSLDTLLSSVFDSRYFSQSAGLSYRLNYEKWNFMIGSSFQAADLENKQEFPEQFTVNRTFYSVLPTAMFQYRFNQKKNIRLFYRSNNNVPSVTQLQEVINNNNPLLLTSGNPNLKQDWQHFINIRYNTANPDKSTSFYGAISGSFTKNYIGNSTFIAPADTVLSEGILLSKGSQLSVPVNIEGYYSLRSFSNYSFPLKFIKSSLNLNANINYSRSPGIINNETNYSNSLSSGAGFALSSNISQKFDFLISSNLSASSIRNTIKENSNSDYFSVISKFRIQVQPWKGLVLQTDVLHQRNSGLSSSFNNNDATWNAAIGYKFMKDRLAEVRLAIFDILEQNVSISRNTTDTYYEDVQSNVLQQYVMLTFTYNLKYFKMDK